MIKLNHNSFMCLWFGMMTDFSVTNAAPLSFYKSVIHFTLHDFTLIIILKKKNTVVSVFFLSFLNLLMVSFRLTCCLFLNNSYKAKPLNQHLWDLIQWYKHLLHTLRFLFITYFTPLQKSMCSYTVMSTKCTSIFVTSSRLPARSTISLDLFINRHCIYLSFSHTDTQTSVGGWFTEASSVRVWIHLRACYYKNILKSATQTVQYYLRLR